ncbi:MAG: hypothetical protein K0U72_10235 [Gammaproteobacteria bacterium]|nr:hypothetical protein [Gammaproteobacteria bacterium]
MKILLILVATIIATPALAEGEDKQATGLPQVGLIDVLEEVGRSTKQVFAVDYRVGPNIVVGHVKTRGMSFDTLRIVLRNNNLASIVVDDIVTIVPTSTIRQQAIPLLFAADESIHQEQWVTHVLTLENIEPRPLVPILRPLLPKQGHLVAHPDSRTLTIVARYGKVRQLVELIEAIDRNAQQ